MTTESGAVSPPRSRPSPVLVLGILGVLTFALVPIRINTIYSGLPAHPLFLHVPVILIPVAGLAALALAARPSWWTRHGVWVTFVAVLARRAGSTAAAALAADLPAAVASAACSAAAAGAAGVSGQSSRTSAPWDSNGARRTSAQPSATRLSCSVTAPVCS